MIIKNNFDNKNALSKNDYQHIGRGENDVNRDPSSNRFLYENKNNHAVQDVIRKDHEYGEENGNCSDDGDKWDFFR